ncbi:MAG: hypothetical protein QHH06_10450 [Clostridiales bacterium]|jgi:hypothetical protein|nr:hypothetical protein [Eubacteriales bacterium]MDH7566886.1 hypothetical protein [Clostridiales bacterium]
MSENFNILNDYDPEKFNLLLPVQSIQEVNPIYKIVVNKVSISTNLADKEIYEERNAEKINNQTMYAITHKGLLKLMTAANGQIVESTRVRPKVCEKCIDIVKATQQAPACGSCACAANVAWKVKMKFPELSGGMRLVEATKEIDFSNYKVKQDRNDSGYSISQINKMKEFAGEQAESKAMSRCIRKGLNIKSAYTLEELKKPFIVAYPVLDSNDADVKKALIAGHLAATNLLYGSGLSAPMLKAAPSNVDTETGEIIDSDYDVEQPDPHQSMPWQQNGGK